MTLETIKIIAEICTPFLVFIFALLLLRKTEQIKSSVSKSSDFSARWANEFFEVYKSFLDDAESIMNILFHLQSADKNEGDKMVEKLREKITSLTKSELHMSIMLSSFPEIDNNELTTNSKKILDALSDIIKTKKGNIDDIKKMISNFSNTARKVHAKLLKI